MIVFHNAIFRLTITSVLLSGYGRKVVRNPTEPMMCFGPPIDDILLLFANIFDQVEQYVFGAFWPPNFGNEPLISGPAQFISLGGQRSYGKIWSRAARRLARLDGEKRG